MLAFVAILSLLAAGDRADAAAAKMPWKDVRPVMVVVLDGRTQKPIRRFSYTYTLTWSADSDEKFTYSFTGSPLVSPGPDRTAHGVRDGASVTVLTLQEAPKTR